MSTPAPATPAEVCARLQDACDQVFLGMSAESTHDDSVLSMSGLGGCSRLAAYQLAGRTPTDAKQGQKRQADLGTWIHDGFLPRLAKVLGGHWSWVEKPVTLTAGDLQVPGRLDLETLAYSADTDGGHTVVDLKTVGLYRFETIQARNRPFDDHWVQILAYAVALTQGGSRVKWVTWIYLCRDNGKTHTIAVELTDDLVKEVFARIAALQRYAAAPDYAPREETGPGPEGSIICNGCAYLQMCWGVGASADKPGAQAAEIKTDADVVAAAVDYAHAREQEAQWKKWKEFHGLQLADTHPGVYTDGDRQITFDVVPGQLRRDTSAEAAALAARGITVPRKRTAASIKVSLR